MQEKTMSKKFMLISYDQTTIEQLATNNLEQLLASVVDDRISWLTVNGLTEADKPMLDKMLSFFKVNLSFTEKIISGAIDDFSGERKDCLYLDFEIFDGYAADTGFKRVAGTAVLGKNFLLTFNKNNVGYFNGQRQKIVDEETRIQEFPVDYLFYLLIRTMITQTKKLLFVDLTQHFEDLEDRIIANPGEDFVLDEIMDLRTQIRPLYDVVLRFGNLISHILEEESRFITDHTRTYFERNLESDRQELWEGYRNIRNWTTQLMDIHRSNMDEKTNDILKILAIISFIFLPITFLASIYGTNFTHMPPEVGWRYGYYGLLGVMVLIAVGLLAYMRKKRWI